MQRGWIFQQNIYDKNVLIIDSIGLLSSIYKYGKIAYIGGGFGVGIHNILEAIDHVNPFAIDVNSGVEISPGIKSHTKIKNFYKKINKTKSTGFKFE